MWTTPSLQLLDEFFIKETATAIRWQMLKVPPATYRDTTGKADLLFYPPIYV
jgi:hypothetical protein